MLNGHLCARWGCEKQATFDKPLCYSHWREWQAWELEECNRCHQVYGQDDDDFRGGGYYALQVYSELYPYLCDPCLRWTIRTEKGEQPPWYDGLQDRMPQMMAHAKLERNTYHVYILKMVDGTFYVGQTLNLDIRMREHRDGLQSQTKGKDPKLVYFERFQGDRDKVSERERELTRLSQSPSGCRRLREMIERFRGPLRLLDLEA